MNNIKPHRSDLTDGSAEAYDTTYDLVNNEAHSKDAGECNAQHNSFIHSNIPGDYLVGNSDDNLVRDNGTRGDKDCHNELNGSETDGSGLSDGGVQNSRPGGDRETNNGTVTDTHSDIFKSSVSDGFGDKDMCNDGIDSGEGRDGDSNDTGPRHSVSSDSSGFGNGEARNTVLSNDEVFKSDVDAIEFQNFGVGDRIKDSGEAESSGLSDDKLHDCGTTDAQSCDSDLSDDESHGDNGAIDAKVHDSDDEYGENHNSGLSDDDNGTIDNSANCKVQVGESSGDAPHDGGALAVKVRNSGLNADELRGAGATDVQSCDSGLSDDDQAHNSGFSDVEAGGSGLSDDNPRTSPDVDGSGSSGPGADGSGLSDDEAGITGIVESDAGFAEDKVQGRDLSPGLRVLLC